MKHLLTVAIGLVAGFAGAALFALSGLGNAQTRDYLVTNPDILPEMARAYQAQEARAQLAEVKDEVLAPFAGAVLGNPQGTKTLVKFTDYACGYCRVSVPDLDQLIAANPDLRVVVRERVTFANSEPAARMSLAAAQQGKYDAFYHAMFALGTPSEEKVEQAARTAGLDMDAARAFSASEAVTQELIRNDDLAQQLNIPGTPSWVFEDQVFEGAVGFEDLNKVVNSSEG